MTKMGMKKTVKPVRTTKKFNRRQFIKKLDSLFSKYVRSDFTCEYCGKTVGLMHCHHGVVHRRYMHTRYELDNCACLCVACHNFLSDFPGINTEFFKKRLGEKRFEQLEILARTEGKVDLEAIEVELKRKIKELNNG